MKRLLSFMLVECLTVGVFISAPKAAFAYCVFNESDHDITALQLDIKPDSFKKVVKPHSRECCNWKDTSCTKNKDGREGKTSFALYNGSHNTSAITAQSVLRKIASITVSIVPVIGGAAKDATTEIFDALDTYITKNAQLGVVTTYNGGIIWYDGKEAVGCWQGPCKGNDINADGSKGPKP